MGPRRTRSAPTWSLLLFAACAASSALPRAVTIAPGDRVRVQLIDLTTGRAFELRNRSSGSRDAVYGEARTESIKVVEDAQLQKLLDVLASKGLFDRPDAAPPPGTRAAITVESGGRRHLWARPVPTPTNLDAVGSFEEGRAYVLAVYNSETSFGLGTIDSFDPQTRQRMEQAKSAAEQGRKQ